MNFTTPSLNGLNNTNNNRLGAAAPIFFPGPIGLGPPWTRQVRPGSSRVGRDPSGPQALKAAGRNKIYINAKRPQAAQGAGLAGRRPGLLYPAMAASSRKQPDQHRKKSKIFVQIRLRFAV